MLEFNLFEKPMLEEDILYKEAMLETAQKGQAVLRDITKKGIFMGEIYDNENRNIVKEASTSSEYDGSEYGGISSAWCR